MYLGVGAQSNAFMYKGFDPEGGLKASLAKLAISGPFAPNVAVATSPGLNPTPVPRWQGATASLTLPSPRSNAAVSEHPRVIAAVAAAKMMREQTLPEAYREPEASPYMTQSYGIESGIEKPMFDYDSAIGLQGFEGFAEGTPPIQPFLIAAGIGLLLMFLQPSRGRRE